MMRIIQVNRFPGPRLWRVLATGFGIGYIPVASGTFGSLLALPLWYWGGGSGAFHFGALAVLMAVAIPAIRAEMNETGEGDPSTAVLDEVCGMLLAATGIPWGALPVLSIFLLFRAFDIVKFGPVAWMDARKGAVYVIADDLFAGLYANLVYRGILWMIG